MSERIKQLLVIASFVVVILFNYLAATGYINGTDTGSISDRYATELTPAGYAFTIWSLIYLGMAAYVVFQALPSKLAHPFASAARIPFVFSCAANSAWLIAWHYDMIPLSVALMFSLLAILALINVKVSDAATTVDVLAIKAPFNLYFGWVTVAAVVNVTISLVAAGADSHAAWASAAGSLLILFAAVIGVFLRFRLKAFLYPIAIAWGTTAIAVKQSGNTPIVVSAAIAVIVLLFVALWGAIKD
jgi:hypothetical protein